MRPLCGAASTPVATRGALPLIAVVALACGSRVQDESPDPDDTKIAPVADHRPFVPEGLEMELAEGTRDELELVAFTLRNGPEFLVAVRNNGAGLYCGVTVNAAPSQDSEISVASGAVDVFGASVYRSAPTAPLWNCLAPGEIGFGGQVGSLQGSTDVSSTTRILHRLQGYVGADLGNLVKVEVAKLEGVRLRNGSPTARVEGSVRNVGSVPIVLFDILVYSLNEVDRPVAVGTRRANATVAAGGVSEFSIDVAGPVGDYRVVLDYSE